MPVDQIIGRVRRALLLDAGAFEEARDDAAFTPYAIALAAIAVVIGSIGSFLWAAIVLGDTGDFFVEAIILGSIFLTLLWIAGILVAYVVLTQIYGETVTPDALARVMALGHLPFALSLLVLIPGIGFGFGVLAVAAMFFYTIFGIRAAYPRIDPLRAMLSVLAAFAVWTMVLPLLTSPGNAFAPGTFVYEWSEDFIEDFANFSFDLGDFDIDFGDFESE
jgi:hypothetical protein